MKTHTTKHNIWLRSFLLLPLIALTLYGFSERKQIEKEPISSEKNTPINKDDKPILSINKNQYSFKLNEQTDDINGKKAKQQKATPDEVVEYNKLAKYFNSQNPDTIVIQQKYLERMEYIYKKMSKEQKEKSEPFPKSIPPPPPPVANPPKVDNGNDAPPPPPPPSPISPLEHIKEMAKKGASFYYEGKSISSDEAIKLLKNNSELNISTKQVDSKEPKVYMSKEPIVVPNRSSNTNNKTKSKNMAVATTYLKIDAESFDDLKEIDWDGFKKIFLENNPDTMVTVEFNYDNPILFDGSKIDSFNHKIYCQTSELGSYLEKSKKLIAKLRPID